MNPIALAFLGMFGGLFAVVLVILTLPYLSPYAGTASAAVVSTGQTFTGILPWIGAILAGGMALAALSYVGRKH